MSWKSTQIVPQVEPAKEAGWMAPHIEQKRQQDSETLGIEIENGLAVSIGSSRMVSRT